MEYELNAPMLIPMLKKAEKREGSKSEKKVGSKSEKKVGSKSGKRERGADLLKPVALPSLSMKTSAPGTSLKRMFSLSTCLFAKSTLRKLQTSPRRVHPENLRSYH